jgi:serine/threonine-protein kinase
MSTLWQRLTHGLRRPSGQATSAAGGVAATVRPSPAPGADPSVPGVGSVIGPFVLQAEIGRGTVGCVYRAVATGSTTPVAVKTLVLAREFQGQALDEARVRFFRQAHTARRLQHPDIVQVLDAGEAHGVAWLSMPLLAGRSLDRCVTPEAPMPVADVLRVGARVARALAHAHGLGVVHRDVKPANVVVDLARDEVKVTDFGIAHLMDAASTRTGLVLGSPAYMSPEQLAGRRLDGRSDLYALGVTLYQLLTGRLPHDAQRLSDLLSQIAQEPAKDVRWLRPEVPEGLALVISLSLEKRPELRYAQGEHMAQDLDAVAAQWVAEGAAAGPPPGLGLSAGAGLA